MRLALTKSVCKSAKVQIRDQIEQNLQMSLREIARNTDLSVFIVHKTLESVMKFKKLFISVK